MPKSDPKPPAPKVLKAHRDYIAEHCESMTDEQLAADTGLPVATVAELRGKAAQSRSSRIFRQQARIAPGVIAVNQMVSERVDDGFTPTVPPEPATPYIHRWNPED